MTTEWDQAMARETRVLRWLALLAACVLAAFAGVLAAGCGGSGSGTPSRALESVAFVGSWTEADRTTARASIAAHTAAFERVYGPVGGHAVEVHAGARLPSGATGEAITGDRPGYRIAAGLDLTCHGATHELHHLRHDPSHGHVDARWPAWDIEDQFVADRLRGR